MGVDGALARPSDTDVNATLQAASQATRASRLGSGNPGGRRRVAVTTRTLEAGLWCRRALLQGGRRPNPAWWSDGGAARIFSGPGAACRWRREGGAAGAGLEAARTRIQIEVRATFDAFNRRLAALRSWKLKPFRGSTKASLATRSFEVGQIGLAELLLIRREIIDTRVQYLDAVLEAAIARVELDARAGVLR